MVRGKVPVYQTSWILNRLLQTRCKRGRKRFHRAWIFKFTFTSKDYLEHSPLKFSTNALLYSKYWKESPWHINSYPNVSLSQYFSLWKKLCMCSTSLKTNSGVWHDTAFDAVCRCQQGAVLDDSTGEDDEGGGAQHKEVDSHGYFIAFVVLNDA